MDPELKRLLEQQIAEQQQTNRLLRQLMEVANEPSPASNNDWNEASRMQRKLTWRDHWNSFVRWFKTH